jgi:predicted N-acetyltransferase YhbS
MLLGMHTSESVFTSGLVPTIKVRSSTRADAAVISDMVIEAFPDLGSGDSEEREILNLAFLSAPTVSRKNRTTSLIALNNGNPAGFLLAGAGEDRDRNTAILTIPYIGVRDEFRFQGVASALIRDVEIKARESGFELMWALVDHDYSRVWQSSGWQVESPGKQVVWIDRPVLDRQRIMPPSVASRDNKIAIFQSIGPVPGQRYNSVAWKLVCDEPRVQPWVMENDRDSSTFPLHLALAVLREPSLWFTLHETTIRGLVEDGLIPVGPPQITAHR